VQARLAQRDDPGAAGEADDFVPVPRRSLGDVVRLDADGGVHGGVLGGEGDAGGAGGGGRGDGEDGGDAGVGGALKYRGQVALEAFVVEVGVGVDELRGHDTLVIGALRAASVSERVRLDRSLTLAALTAAVF